MARYKNRLVGLRCGSLRQALVECSGHPCRTHFLRCCLCLQGYVVTCTLPGFLKDNR